MISRPLHPIGSEPPNRAHTVSTMAQRGRLKNAKWRKLDQEARNIVDSIMKHVSTAIHIRTTARQVVLNIVEDAMKVSDAATALRQKKSQAIASLRHDLKVIDFRRNALISITNPISGEKYSVSLSRSDMPQLENAGYDIKHIKSGTTQHIYAALRAMLPDIGRSTSIRIWYTTDSGEDVTVPANEMPALRLVGKKLFMMKLWGCPAADSQQGNQQRSGSWTRLWTDENGWIWVWLHDEDGWTNDSFWGWTDEIGWIQFPGHERRVV